MFRVSPNHLLWIARRARRRRGPQPHRRPRRPEALDQGRARSDAVDPFPACAVRSILYGFTRSHTIVLRLDDKEERSMAHTLPPLPYPTDALEPHIDKQTMEIHHGKHHNAYVDEPERRAGQAPRAAVEERRGPDSQHQQRARRHPHRRQEQRRRSREPLDVLADHGARRPAARRPAPSPTRSTSSFGSFDNFKEEFKKAGVGRFGSGWAWVVDNGGKLVIESTPNQDSPLMDGKKAGLRRRRLGARLLPEISEPPARLSRRLVERRQLGRDQQEASEQVDISDCRLQIADLSPAMNLQSAICDLQCHCRDPLLSSRTSASASSSRSCSSRATRA